MAASPPPKGNLNFLGIVAAADLISEFSDFGLEGSRRLPFVDAVILLRRAAHTTHSPTF